MRAGAVANKAEVKTGIWHKLFTHFDQHLNWYFPLPAILALAAIVAFPMVYNIWLSLHDWFLVSPIGPQWVGLQNYVQMFQDPKFWTTFWRMLYFIVGALAVQVPLGLLLALFLNQEFRARNLIRTIYLFPFAATPVAIALVWGMMFNPELGVLNYFLELFGLPRSLWIASEKWVIPSLILVDSWEWTPLIMIITLAGLQSLPKQPYEAAVIDGASSWQIFRYITLPLIRPTLVVATMLRSIDLIKTFDIIYVMTQGGPGEASETLYLYTYKTGFQFFHMGYGAALVVFVFALVLVFNLVLARVRR
ncbi:MAG: sugar ABC transporter permease [Firmicutes bacterium]|nr:sugar ABC transporter permease [Bacillota bacterium]